MARARRAPFFQADLGVFGGGRLTDERPRKSWPVSTDDQNLAQQRYYGGGGLGLILVIAVDDRRFLNGILWILQSDAPWRDLPKSFAPGLNRRTPHRRSLDSTFTNKSRATRRGRMCAIASVANLG